MNNGFLEIPWIEPIIDSIKYLLSHQAVIGPLLLLMIEESGIPLPVPGDVIIAYTGYNITKGLLPYWVGLTIIMVSVLLGSSILFWVSSRWGNYLIMKFGRFLHLHPERLSKVEKSFKKYGPLVIIFGRHIPGFRIPITVFAGISGVSYKTFILSTFVSTLLWVIFYLDLGMRLGRRVNTFLRISVSHTNLLILLLILLGGIIIFYQKLFRRR